ncbi:MAG TPA: glutathione S-transferase family protein [Deltaproteobacteria bacterium]|nr:glutathione S-transferase family protein [Candidatus Binatota bacterium]HIL13930.1 glutathione S-transferase family protein [Deltaproteobacteria bacterium]
MKLYVDRLAPNARRVLMFVAEKTIELSIVEVNVAEDEHRSDDFLAMNPLGQVPVLELSNGSCISESMAICRYLDESFPQTALFGLGAEQRAIVHMWSRRVELGLFVAAVDLGHHSNPAFRGQFEQVPAYAELCRASIARSCELLDTQLKTTRFVAGDEFSVADIVAYCGVELARLWEATPGTALQSLGRWQQETAARPSATVARYS